MARRIPGIAAPEALDLIERRWTCAVLKALLDGKLRFTDLKARIGGITDSALTDRLKDLVSLGILERRPLSEWRQANEYAIIGPVDDLRSMFAAMDRWYAAVHPKE